jgi:hypothetical protein
MTDMFWIVLVVAIAVYNLFDRWCTYKESMKEKENVAK